MDSTRPPLLWAPWHPTECSLCGIPINQQDTVSYQAIPTQPGLSGRAVPGLHGGHFVLEYESTVSFSYYRLEGTLPALYLIDNTCCKIHNLHSLQDIRSLDTFRNVIRVVKPTGSVDSRNAYPLTASDAETLVAKFEPSKPPTARSYHLQRSLPFELRRQVMLHYGLADVLQLAVTLQAPAFFDETLRNDPVRKRVAMSIQASKLLHKKEHQTFLTEKTVTLSRNMKLLCIDIGGEKYIQDIVKESSCPEAVEITIEGGRAQLLALHVDDWGIRDIAFASDEKGHLRWALDVARKVEIFMDEEAFERIRIVSDPLKCRMIDADLPGRDSFHPRPLLPVRTGNWAPRAVNTVKGRYLEVEGYAKASYINFSACETVYLSCGLAGSLQGIFAEDGKDRQALYLGHGSKRTVKVLGLRRFAQCDAVLIQIQAEDGQYLPDLDITDSEILGEECHQEVEGIWWVVVNGKFLINVVHKFMHD